MPQKIINYKGEYTMPKIKNENYCKIEGWMINQLKLKGTALIVYAVILSFSKSKAGKYTGGRQYLCEWAGGITKPTVDKILRELVKNQYVFRSEEIIDRVKYVHYKANPSQLKKLGGGDATNCSRRSKNDEKPGQKNCPNNSIQNNNDVYLNWGASNHGENMKHKRCKKNAPRLPLTVALPALI